MIYHVTVGERTYRVELARSDGAWRCKLDGRDFPLDAAALGANLLSLLVNGRSYEVRQESASDESTIIIGRERFSAVVHDPRSLRARAGRERGGHGPKKITAPMPGKVVRVLASVGSEVEAGQAVMVIEAMKMQNELKAPKKGKITRLTVTQGAAVEAGQTLAEVE